MSQTITPPASVVPEPDPLLLQRAAAVRRAAMALGQCSDAERRLAVEAMAAALEAASAEILEANRADLAAAAVEPDVVHESPPPSSGYVHAAGSDEGNRCAHPAKLRTDRTTEG